MADRARDRDRRPPVDKSRDPTDRAGSDRPSRIRSRSPRRHERGGKERGGRRSDNRRYRSRSPTDRDSRNNDAEKDSPRGAPRGGRDDRRGDARGGRDDARGREPPSGPRAPFNDQGRDRIPDRKPEAPAKVNTTAITSKDSSKQDVKDESKGSTDVVMTNTQGLPDLDDETMQIIKVMGFGSFKSTKETKVPGNDKNYGVRRDKKMEARQYMNRQGGFNRPLSPSRM